MQLHKCLQKRTLVSLGVVIKTDKTTLSRLLKKRFEGRFSKLEIWIDVNKGWLQRRGFTLSELSWAEPSDSGSWSLSADLSTSHCLCLLCSIYVHAICEFATLKKALLFDSTSYFMPYTSKMLIAFYFFLLPPIHLFYMKHYIYKQNKYFMYKTWWLNQATVHKLWPLSVRGLSAHQFCFSQQNASYLSH